MKDFFLGSEVFEHNLTRSRCWCKKKKVPSRFWLIFKPNLSMPELSGVAIHLWYCAKLHRTQTIVRSSSSTEKRSILTIIYNYHRWGLAVRANLQSTAAKALLYHALRLNRLQLVLQLIHLHCSSTKSAHGNDSLAASSKCKSD